jgi:hypothetical protein
MQKSHQHVVLSAICSKQVNQTERSIQCEWERPSFLPRSRHRPPPPPPLTPLQIGASDQPHASVLGRAEPVQAGDRQAKPWDHR